MFRDLSASATTMGLLSAFAGFASSFAVVLQGLKGVGASNAEAASGLMVLAIAMGLGGILLSFRSKIPVSVAWSTPGAAFLAISAVPEGGFAAAVGAFIVCSIGITIAGLFKPLEKAVGAIPMPLANAMLGGVLLGMCIAPFKAIAAFPVAGTLMFGAWLLFGAWRKSLAVPAALAAFVCVVLFGLDLSSDAFSGIAASAAPDLVFVSPAFTLESIVNIALPLFIITMASQNLTGVAVLKSYNYPVKPGFWFMSTGLYSLLAAPFGGHGVNLAAITAAMCAGEEAHPDPAKRYWAAIVAGIGYIAFGLLAGLVTAFVSLAPALFVQAVAGLALIGAFARSTQLAFSEEGSREAAAVTFLVTASGMTLFGLSGAFWGLVAGGAVMASKHVFGQSAKL